METRLHRYIHEIEVLHFEEILGDYFDTTRWRLINEKFIKFYLKYQLVSCLCQETAIPFLHCYFTLARLRLRLGCKF